MKETFDTFFSRIYVNFIKGIVLVYRDKVGLDLPKLWSLAQARQYINYLEQEEVIV